VVNTCLEALTMATVLTSEEQRNAELWPPISQHTMVCVRLADDQWATKGDCRRFARLALEQHTADIVQVIEHAGWYETYIDAESIARTGNDDLITWPYHRTSGLLCIETANDQATWQGFMAAVRREYLADYRVIGSIESATLVSGKAVA
jgi:hypothetical protein